MTVFLLTIAAALAALAGGYTAIHFRSKLQIAMALTAGLVLGVVAFDLLPEIFVASANENLDTAWPMALLVIGFLIFHVIEKFVLVHHGMEDEYKTHHHPKLGIIRAVALAGHSFLDGLSIGVGFQVSPTVGAAVAIAVVGHRFADGFDTATFMLQQRNSLERIKQLLGFVVIMPILGGLASLFITLSEATLSLYLGFFAGVLLYIAASNILPQAHTKVSSYKSVGLTILGAAIMFVITRLA